MSATTSLITSSSLRDLISVRLASHGDVGVSNLNKSRSSRNVLAAVSVVETEFEEEVDPHWFVPVCLVEHCIWEVSALMVTAKNMRKFYLVLRIERNY